MSRIPNAMTKLHVGDRAPALQVTTLDGERRGLLPRPTLVSFHRFGTCVFCNLRIHHLVEAHPGFATAGVEMLCIFESSVENVTASVARKPVPFTIACDPSLVSYNDWGVERSMLRLIAALRRVGDIAKAEALELVAKNVPREGNADRVPAEFVVDAQGIIRFAYYGKDAGDHAPVDAILAAAVANPAAA